MGWYSEYYRQKNKGFSIKPLKITSEKTEVFKRLNNKNLSNEYDKTNKSNYIQENLENKQKLKSLKVIIFLIPIIILAYILYQNLLASNEFNYLYDVGMGDFLSPYSRITEIIKGENSSYRNLISGLVYFEVPIPRNSNKIKIQTRFKPNFPEDYVMTLGAKDRKEWHYKWNQLYNPILNEITEFQSQDNVFLINKNLYLVPFEELKYERNIIIASDNPFYNPLTNTITDYKNIVTVINTTLRGGHTFYIYANNNFNVEVKKQDINWYEGRDDLIIGLFDSNDSLIENFTIEDDGIMTINTNISAIQSTNFTFKNLSEGVYILKFYNFDGLIREIKLNTNKIVTNKLFLADNQIYKVNQTPSKIYLKSSRPSLLSFKTWHKVGIQNITINNEIISIKNVNNATYFTTKTGNHTIISPNNDIIIESPLYFSFSEENYFEPFRQIIIPIRNDRRWLNNIDYLVTNYKKPYYDNGWLIAETEFDIKKDNLFIRDNKLSFVYNVPHLSIQEYSNYTIPIDWINITVYKPSVLKI